MKYYFLIQFRRLIRHIQDFGVHPIFGLIVIGLLFLGLSLILFDFLPDYAAYIIVFLAVNIFFTLSNIKNKEFLKLSFTKKEFKQLRLLENSLASIPFLFVFLIQFELLFAGALILIALFTANMEFSKRFNYSFPTPFSKHPFEFSRGFRKSILIYPLAYILTIIGVSVGNMNLGIFAILLLGLSNAHFYSFTEPDYYVWVYREGARKVLSQKFKKGLSNLFIGIIPILILLLIFFPDGVIYPLITIALSGLFLMANMVLKYAHFPRNFEVIQAILLPLTFLFPPLLFAIIPYYYSKAIQQINALTQ
ncbi:MAG: hypothetical protein JKY48_06185 [Flavobacteriales bacterium]|nr:hypothetical protein [Flavobacteriales bacterium]